MVIYVCQNSRPLPLVRAEDGNALLTFSDRLVAAVGTGDARTATATTANSRRSRRPHRRCRCASSQLCCFQFTYLLALYSLKDDCVSIVSYQFQLCLAKLRTCTCTLWCGYTCTHACVMHADVLNTCTMISLGAATCIDRDARR